MKELQQAELRRVEIREILKRHEGSITALANELGLKVPTVSGWLYGKTKSKRIADAAHEKALDLLKQERLARGAA